MKKIRLKEDCRYPTMFTPYGLIGHDWVEVSDDVYVYKEMEVQGQKVVEKPIFEKTAEKVEVKPVKKAKVEKVVAKKKPTILGRVKKKLYRKKRKK